ncbi:MAG TPA: sugar phosphate isomerase/epimerase [Candidatus Limnocylindrales bacterium]|nr:sugar phosphate isomerase/epimerase [Candidatus Limnocylindrales bacterium]
MRADQIALQLWTVRDLAAVDLPGTLTAVAAAGYRSVELAGLHETATDDLARLLEQAALQPVAAHVGVDRLRADLPAVADRHAALGCDRVIVPSLPEEERRTADDVRRFASQLNAIGGELADRGIRLGYHNHDFEFAPIDGTTAWDVLLDELGPDVQLELDVFWASVGGRDPAAVIRDGGSRIRLLHMKDRAAGPELRDAPAGAGVLDLEGIVAAGRDAGVEWYVAEQDEPDDALADISRAYAYLHELASTV